MRSWGSRPEPVLTREESNCSQGGTSCRQGSFFFNMKHAWGLRRGNIRSPNIFTFSKFTGKVWKRSSCRSWISRSLSRVSRYVASTSLSLCEDGETARDPRDRGCRHQEGASTAPPCLPAPGAGFCPQDAHVTAPPSTPRVCTETRVPATPPCLWAPAPGASAAREAFCSRWTLASCAPPAVSQTINRGVCLFVFKANKNLGLISASKRTISVLNI